MTIYEILACVSAVAFFAMYKYVTDKVLDLFERHHQEITEQQAELDRLRSLNDQLARLVGEHMGEIQAGWEEIEDLKAQL